MSSQHTRTRTPTHAYVRRVFVFFVFCDRFFHPPARRRKSRINHFTWSFDMRDVFFMWVVAMRNWCFVCGDLCEWEFYVWGGKGFGRIAVNTVWIRAYVNVVFICCDRLWRSTFRIMRMPTISIWCNFGTRTIRFCR